MQHTSRHEQFQACEPFQLSWNNPHFEWKIRCRDENKICHGKCNLCMCALVSITRHEHKVTDHCSPYPQDTMLMLKITRDGPVIHVRMSTQAISQVIVSGVLSFSAVRRWDTMCWKAFPLWFSGSIQISWKLKCLIQYLKLRKLS